jgi:hypothetical protein
MTFDPHFLDTARLRQAYDYWDAIREHRPMPARRDIDPAGMVPWLASTFLVDVLYDPLEFRFRLVGTEVVHRFGMEITGRKLRELNLHGREHQTRAEYTAVVETRAPRYSIEVSGSRNDWEIERLLMPLSDDGLTVNMLFGVQHAVTAYRWETGLSAV